MDSKLRNLQALVDSGAEVNLLDREVAARLGLKPRTSAMTINVFDGRPVEVLGQCELVIQAQDGFGHTARTTQRFYLTDVQEYDIILGHPWLIEVDPEIYWKAGYWAYRQPRIVGAEVVTARQFAKYAHKHPEAQMGVVMVLPQSRTASVRTAKAGQRKSSADHPHVLPVAYADFADVFSEEGASTFPENSKVKHSIQVEEGQTAPWGPLYPLSAKELGVLREYLESSLAKGWIRPSESSAGAPILFVPKQDGSLRLCVDYRGLNKVTVKNRYPLPLIWETLDRLAGAKVFTKLDLRDAYHRIRIEDVDIWKTAFRTRYGHFEYLVMPFGLTNAPATFQAYINDALKGLLDISCVAFMDDIIIYSSDVAEHRRHVRAVLARLREYSLYVKQSKCDFDVTELAFLGYRISTEGIEMDPQRVQAIQEWPVPNSFRDIQVFLGFANFYRIFIASYSRITAPITSLLVGMVKGKKTGPFTWTPEAQEAFEELKRRFMSAPLLVHYDPERRSRVEADASGEAIGGILTQEYIVNDRSVWHPIAFYSAKMLPAETRYTTGDQEMLAIVRSFKEWRHYLEGAKEKTLVLSDHETLNSFMGTKALSRRQARWAEALAAFDFTIQYRKGKENPADGLSRRPDHMRGGTPEEYNPMKTLIEERLEGVAAESAPRDPRDASARIGVTTRGQSRRPGEPSSKAVATQSSSESDSTDSEDSEESASMQDVRNPGAKAPHENQPPDDRTPGAMLKRIPTALESAILHAQAQDAWCISKKWEQYPNGRVPSGRFRGEWAIDDAGIVRCERAAYVPQEGALRSRLLQLNHDDPWQGGHFGRKRTREVLSRFYIWPGMAADVNKYIRTCDVCQRMKTPRHKPYGLLAPLPQPQGPWQDIAMDFVVGLPPSRCAAGKPYDAILVVVDRYSKMCRYIPTRTEVDASQLATILIAEVFSKFGTPRSIVSDRGTTFTAKYWGTFCYYLTIRRCFSTAFHPQTDGQTERMNQTLECYLRCYVREEQDDWAQLLPGAEFAVNSAVSETTGKAPFDLVLLFTPSLHVNLGQQPLDSENIAAKDSLQRVEQAAQRSRATWADAQQASKKYYDKKHKAREYQIGEKVLLSARNIRTRRTSAKLSDKFLGPFAITKRVGSNAYHLELPVKYERLHPVFHVSLLEPYHQRPGVAPPPPIDIEGEEHYEVERILGKIVRKSGEVFYHIRWKGCPPSDDSWEPAKHLAASRLIEKFERATQQ